MSDDTRTPQQLFAEIQASIRAALEVIDRIHPEAATPMQVIDLIRSLHVLASTALRGVGIAVELTDQLRRLEMELYKYGGRHQGRIDPNRDHEDRGS